MPGLDRRSVSSYFNYRYVLVNAFKNVNNGLYSDIFLLAYVTSVSMLGNFHENC
jgi:hypothetical protein